MDKKILLIGACGYIGTYLYKKLYMEGVSPNVCDQLIRGNKLQININPSNYEDLDEHYLNNHDVVIWFAGHSSVPQSIKDPQGALENNCINLYSLGKKLKNSTKLIYASSASLYSKNDGFITPAKESDLVKIPYQNAYDVSKFSFDYIAENFLSNYYGLRMGTVSGYSNNLRPELLFNSMSISAYKSKKVYLKNNASYRTILFLEDLWLFIKQILLNDVPCGFYNLGSISGTIGEFAQNISSAWDAEVVDQGDSETYSFLLDTSLMNQYVKKQYDIDCLPELSKEFISEASQYYDL
jgi:nucleoside-diphosphate-sugar epimerase